MPSVKSGGRRLCGSTYLIVATVAHRPWWGLGLVKGQKVITAQSPAGTTGEKAEEMRGLFLEADGCISARLETLELGE